MGDKTGIEWTDATWNPTTGCDKVSSGCDNCYAMTLAPRLQAMERANGRAETGHYQRDGDPRTSGPGFGFSEHPDALDKPLRWQRPRLIFVNSMSDLFHEKATKAFVAQVFAVMAAAPQHTFQVLTKRPGKMRSWLNDDRFVRMVNDAYYALDLRDPDPEQAWPLPNVWLGTSTEDQKTAALRIPALLGTPAAVRFLSMEPLLGPVNLTLAVRSGWRETDDGWRNDLLHWVIVGGESGPGSRRMEATWVRDLRDQCVAAGIPFHFKQWGNFNEQGEPQHKKDAGRQLDGRTWDEWPSAAETTPAVLRRG